MLTIDELTSLIIPVIRQYPVKKAALFGSYARGEQTEESDVDLIVELHTDHRYECKDYLYELWDKLELATAKPVDIVTYSSLTQRHLASLVARINRDVICFYEV